jgi:LL-diaminopimelate aminotransferase
VRLAGGTPVPLPLDRADGFLPDYSRVGRAVAEAAKLLWICYPGNPTGATCELDTFERSVEFARTNNVLLAHDAAYSEITYDGYTAPSVLQIDGAKDVAVELHSFSKTFNMTGWRVGWICGNAEAIEALGRLKTNLDSGVFNAIQRACIAALTGPMDFLADQLDILARRRNNAVAALQAAGIDATAPRGSFYLFVPVPEGHTSESFAARLLDEAAVVVAPGNGYGANGEGFVRFSLTLPDDRLEVGIERIRRLSL